MLGTLVTPVQAEFTMATVDLNRIMNDSPQSKEQRKTLDTLSNTAKKKIDARRQGITEKEKSLKSAGVKADSKEAQAFQKEARDFNRFIKDTEDEFKAEFIKINKALTDRAIESVRAYAKKNNIDLVIERSEKTKGPVIFGSPTVDITDDVLKGMK